MSARPYLALDQYLRRLYPVFARHACLIVPSTLVCAPDVGGSLAPVVSCHADVADGHPVLGHTALDLQLFHSDCLFFAQWESVMKKFVPFVFFAIMAGLIGAKIAVAGEVSADAVTAQVELRN